MDFSVLMSVYKNETADNLEECFFSIFNQILKPFELILVLDGELTGELYSVIAAWEAKLPIVTVPLDKNLGLGKALNIGLTYCSCNLVARMDTDDICMPMRFKKQIDEFKKYPQLDICGTYIVEFDQVPENVLSKRSLPVFNESIKNKCIWFNPFNHMTVMYKKSSVEKVGGYKHMPWMEDWYLWLRMIAFNCTCSNIPEYLVQARTGIAMIERRLGFKYIKSEWLLTKVKVSLSLTNWPTALFIFIIRSFPRMLPKKVLFYIYLFSRRIN